VPIREVFFKPPGRRSTLAELERALLVAGYINDSNDISTKRKMSTSLNLIRNVYQVDSIAEKAKAEKKKRPCRFVFHIPNSNQTR
jgi:hypothetical protein